MIFRLTKLILNISRFLLPLEPWKQIPNHIFLHQIKDSFVSADFTWRIFRHFCSEMSLAWDEAQNYIFLQNPEKKAFSHEEGRGETSGGSKFWSWPGQAVSISYVSSDTLQ